MRYLMTSKTDAATFEAGIPPAPEVFERMGAFMAEAAQAGALLQAEGLLPTRFAARVVSRAGEVTVTDGPFAEAKEIVGGFALIQARSMEEAKGWARKFADAAGGDISVEIRQIADDGGDTP
ncbi:YciI family protein [Mumia quercus]|uniref:YciI family protein n=1 Tax=Mumia quercus TaxID=2976125 RepID=UPI0021D1D3E6|nr:YciI family protein [Mumia quercus]